MTAREVITALGERMGLNLTEDEIDKTTRYLLFLRFWDLATEIAKEADDA